MKKRKRIVLKPESKIKYIGLTEKWGKAEFQVCPIFKYGKLKKVLIYPRQQDTKYYYEIPANNQKEFQFASWTHKGIENPWVWRMVWCKEHKTISYNVTHIS